MKTSMRKVLVVLLVVGCLLVSGTFREASAQLGSGTIAGTYACTFSATTLVSPDPFDYLDAEYRPHLEPGPPGSPPTISPVNVNTSSGYGTWTFHKDGTGSAEISLIYSVDNATPYYSYAPVINPQAISFDFTYTLANDRTVNIDLVVGTFVATYRLSGQDYQYTQNQYGFTGTVSLDTKTITLNRKASGYATRTYQGPGGSSFIRYAIGHSSYVLIKVSP